MADHLNMSDEDFLNQPVPEMVPAEAAKTPEAENPETNKAAEPEQAPAAEPAKVVEKVEDPKKPVDPIDAETAELDAEKAANEAAKPAEEAKSADATGSDPKPDAVKDAPAEEQVVDAKVMETFYKEVMKPFKANGKEIALKSPEEARQLMQMGANFTRKMQELAPHRKLITMLGNNKIDEDKLSFLIDLDKKDPEAIKRLIKDSGLDPLDIDTTTEPAYREGNHKVSDQDQAFITQLEELRSSPAGEQTLIEIEDNWDQASKDTLYQQPELMAIISAQREAGIYDQVVTEIDRLKTLGQMPVDKQFLQAYQIAGDALHAKGAFTQSGGEDAGNSAKDVTVDTPAGKPDPTPVAVRTATPKSDVAAGDKAAAASPSRTSPTGVKAAVNVLAMSDEEFAKLEPFTGRV